MSRKNWMQQLLHRKISRRRFLKYSLMGIGGLACAGYGLTYLHTPEHQVFRGEAPEQLWKWHTEAHHYTKTAEGTRCGLCPHGCFLTPDDRGFCRVRVNKNNTLYSIAYGNPASVHMDPIEKKPLFHFLPESRAFSVSTGGCNLRCRNCQNWQLSQSRPEELNNYDLMPDKLVGTAVHNHCRSIAYTYSEPTVFYEYMLDAAKKAHKLNLKNVYITSGYINDKPLRALCRYIDAANLDIKSFSEDIYERLNAGSLQPVLDTLRIMKEEGVWIEITHLIVPGWTDEPEMTRSMARWLVEHGFKHYPMHLSRFTPSHKLSHLPPTPVSTLEKARSIALEEGMQYVYIGNVYNHKAEHTYCPGCKETVIKRQGYKIIANRLTNGRCPECNHKIAGVWNA